MSHCDIRVLDRLGHSVSLIRAERTRSAFLVNILTVKPWLYAYF